MLNVNFERGIHMVMFRRAWSVTCYTRTKENRKSINSGNRNELYSRDVEFGELCFIILSVFLWNGNAKETKDFRLFVISNDFDALWWLRQFLYRNNNPMPVTTFVVRLINSVVKGPIKIMRLMYSPASSHGIFNSYFTFRGFASLLSNWNNNEFIGKQTHCSAQINHLRNVFFYYSHMRFMTFANSKISSSPILFYSRPHFLCFLPLVFIPLCSTRVRSSEKKKNFCLKFHLSNVYDWSRFMADDITMWENAMKILYWF